MWVGLPQGAIKKKTMRLPGRAWQSQLFLWSRDRARLYRQSDQQRSYSYCRYYSMQELFRLAQQDHPLT